MSAASVLSLIAPQFDDVENRDQWISFAECETNRAWYGCSADRAVALRAAHMLTLATDENRSAGETGTVSAKKEGDLSLSYAIPQIGVAGSDLGLTYYGLQLLALGKSSNVGIGVIGGAGRVE